MTTSTKTASFVPLAQLPRAPASDFKMLGWPGVMNTLRANGTLLVTNHDGPEAVIIPVGPAELVGKVKAGSVGE